MKWFKHISDSLDDPFIFELMEEFGSDGYVVFFGILEIYSREFSTKNDWKLNGKLSFFRHKLLISSSKLKKILSKITKWEVTFNEDMVTIFIPKFKELLDETTLKKLRQKEESFRNRSGIVPKKSPTDIDKEEDADIDKEEDKKDIGSQLDVDPPACPHQSIISLFHEIIPELPRVAKWTPKRSQHLQFCWRDKTRQSIEWWRDYFLKVRGSPFLLGDNPRGWKADLEWLTTESNLVKVLEGKYNGNGSGVTGGTGTFAGKAQTGRSYGDGNPYPIDDIITE